MVKQILKYQYLIFFLVVLVFRLTYASLIVNFTQDQARDVALMQQMRDSGTVLVGYGPKASVANFYLAPFYYQLHYVLSWFTNNHPLTMHYFTAVAESLTPLLLLLILKKFVERPTAYLCSFLYAVSPLATIFGTFAWNPNMIPFLSTLSLLLFLEFWAHHKLWQLVGALLAVTIAVHLHYQAVVLAPFVLWMLIATVRRHRALWYWLIAIFASLMTLVPYVLAELSSSWHNTKQILEFFTGEHARYYDRVSKPEFVLTFIPQFFERVFYKESFGWMKVLIGRIVFVGGFIWLTLMSFKKSKIGIVFIYFALILIMLRVYKGDKLDYYMSTLFILPYFLLALLIQFKKIFVGLAVVIAWLAGGQYAQLKSVNQLAELENAVRFLNKIESERTAKFIFHDDNYINIFSYGLRHFGDWKHDGQSKLIIDVCYAEQNCDWDGFAWCAYDRGFTHMALFRQQANYQFVYQYSAPGAYNLRIGKVELVPEINYPISLYDSEYGTDLIDTNWQ